MTPGAGQPPKRESLRIALECHTCLEWLTPSVDAMRARWPQVDIEVVTGHASDPVSLLHEHVADAHVANAHVANAHVANAHVADIALVDHLEPEPDTEFFNLFRYRLMAILANDHPLAQKKVLEAEGFRDAELVTYPIQEGALNIVRKLLKPAGIPYTRRTMALTLAIVMRVSTSRGIAVLPRWVVEPYLQRKDVTARPITAQGLIADVWAATRTEDCDKPCLVDFMALIRATSATHLADIV